jgi:hypothetical protein
MREHAVQSRMRGFHRIVEGMKRVQVCGGSEEEFPIFIKLGEGIEITQIYRTYEDEKCFENVK